MDPMSESSDQRRARAEANFTKAETKAQADRQVVSGIAAEAKAVDEKTAKLRAMRMARDEEQAAVALSEAKPKAKKTRSKA